MQIGAAQRGVEVALHTQDTAALQEPGTGGVGAIEPLFDSVRIFSILDMHYGVASGEVQGLIQRGKRSECTRGLRGIARVRFIAWQAWSRSRRERPSLVWQVTGARFVLCRGIGLISRNPQAVAAVARRDR